MMRTATFTVIILRKQNYAAPIAHFTYNWCSTGCVTQVVGDKFIWASYLLFGILF